MIGRILHWIYCLPLWEAAVLALMFSGGYYALHRRHQAKGWFKVLTVVLLLCWAAGMLAHTVLNRHSHSSVIVELIPLQTYVNVYNGGDK